MPFEKFRIASAACAALVFMVSLTSRADEPTTAPTSQPAILHADDMDGIAASMDKNVVIEAIVEEAEWSNSGKVMNVTFVGAVETKLSAVVFVKNRDAIDKAFGGDASLAWRGAKVRIHGKLQTYAGKSATMKGKPEVIISEPGQVTVVELPTTQPAK